MLATLERKAFRTLNSVAGPLVRRGFGSPCLTPMGLVALEHKGRRTGKIHTSPLVALRMGSRVVVATFRTERSQWIRNLKEQPLAALWIHGKRREVRAEVMEAGGVSFSVLEPI